ncbi:MAG: Maf family protein [Corallococcus sp.]|nr:Maf family protein [Corallococcus sp.]MCM1359505.1 Maf family protein [Corallococcus sp.]MCM1395097.1 Maf family protein [Corallococcus sp.]
MKIILASNSPRRKELLSKIVPAFDIIPSDEPEVSSATEPTAFVKELAFHKAMSVHAQNRDALVIGCDTVVDLDGQILGKPSTPECAKQMLHALSGRTHFVHTGTFIIYKTQMYSFCESTAVTFRTLTESEIDVYVSGGAAMDKAGAYGIQECGFVESYDGSYDNVVGFPTERIEEILNTLIKG